MTERKRRQNLAKCCSVSLQSWMNQWKLLESEQSSTRLGKKTSTELLALKYGTCLIFPQHCCNHRSKRIEAVQFHHIASGVETEQVFNPAVRTTEPSCACLIELKTEQIWTVELEEVISMQLRSKITVARNIRIHHHSLLNAKRKMQLFSV